MLYYGMFILYFGLCWQLVGIELRSTDGEDKDDMKFVYGTWAYSYRIFSDPAALPSYESLESNGNIDEDQFYHIHDLIYFFWLGNQVICLIILLNVLITIIGQVYDKTVENTKMHRYDQKAKMNIFTLGTGFNCLSERKFQYLFMNF